MSRIGKQPIIIPTGVEVKINEGLIVVKGPKGQLEQKIHPQVKLDLVDGAINVSVQNSVDKLQRALWGLFASLIRNMVIGVTEGFTKQLEINGVGFKASVSGNKLILNVGFSHPVEYNTPAGIEIKTEGNLITVSGSDKQLVGKVAAEIRKTKKPEPYKGKGIKYIDEQVRRKAGKASVSREA